jgi:uncharacterized protein
MNDRFDLRTSKLFWAIELNKDIPEIEAALSQHPSVDIQDLDGNTPLIRAAFLGQVPTVKLLQARRARLDAANDIGDTALHFVAQELNAPVMQTLLNAGATVDAVDQHGNTPLQRAVFAAQDGSEPVIRLLLAAGADAGHKNKHGVSARDLAETTGMDLPSDVG